MRLGVVATHPIQYQAPLFRELAQRLDLQVYYCHRQTAGGQAAAGFGVPFDWDVPLLDGYAHTFLQNRARRPDVSTFDGCDTPEIANVVRRERFDALLLPGWYNRSYRQALRACWSTATPVMIRGDSQLATPRSRVKRVVKEAVYRRFIPRFDRYLIVGERAREYFLHYGADERRMHFAPHFVDSDSFAEGARAVDPAGLRRELSLPDDAVILLFVGKLIPKKRPADLIRAAAVARTRGLDVRPVFVGSGVLHDAMADEAGQLGVPVHFAGFKNQTELPYYYAGSDLLGLPSDGGETWGLVVNEAMACGLPAIVSDQVGCAVDLIEEGRTGYTFPMGDVNVLAAAIEMGARMRSKPAVARGIEAKVRRYSLAEATNGVLEAMEASLSSRGGCSRIDSVISKDSIIA